MAERHLQATIIKWARSQGWFARPTLQNHYGSGLPDLFAIKGGRTVWLEVKSKNGQTRKIQRHVMKQMVEHEAEVHVVWSLKEAQRVLS